MSLGSGTTTSSKLRQFGLYRTIDSRTEEFLKLSRKRQIRQGCACAAVSTIITITIVVSVVLVYDLSKDSAMSRRKPNNLLWLENVNDTDMTLFDEKYNKANFNVDRASLKILPVIIKALNKNRFLEKIIEEEASPQETTEFAYEKNVFSDVRNWLKLPQRLYTIDYKTSPIIYYRKPNNDYLTKVRKITDYQKIISYLDNHMERKTITNDKKEPEVQPLTTITEDYKSQEIKPLPKTMNKSDTHETQKNNIQGINVVIDEASLITTTNGPILNIVTTHSNKIIPPTVIQNSCKCPKNLGEIIGKVVSGFKVIMPKLLNMKHKCGKFKENKTKVDTKVDNMSVNKVTKPYKGYQESSAINPSHIMGKATTRTTAKLNNNPSMPKEIDYSADLTLDYLSNKDYTTPEINIDKISSTPNMRTNKFLLYANKQIFNKKNNINLQTNETAKSEDSTYEDLSFQTAIPVTKDTNTDYHTAINKATVNHTPIITSKLPKWFREYKPMTSPFWSKYLTEQRMATPRYADVQKPITDTVTTEETFSHFEATPSIKATAFYPDTTTTLSRQKNSGTKTSLPFNFHFKTNQSKFENQNTENVPKPLQEFSKSTTPSQKPFCIFDVQNSETTRQFDDTETDNHPKDTKTTQEYEDTKTTHRFDDTKSTILYGDTKAAEQFDDTKIHYQYANLKTTHRFDDTKSTLQYGDTKTVQQFDDKKTTHQNEDLDTAYQFEDTKTAHHSGDMDSTKKNQETKTTHFELTKTTKKIGDILLPSPQEIQRIYMNHNKNKTRSKNLFEKHNFVNTKPKKIITIKTHHPDTQNDAEEKSAQNEDRLEDAAMAEKLERHEELFDYDIPQSLNAKEKYPILPYTPETIDTDSNNADRQQSIERSTEAQIPESSVTQFYGVSNNNFDYAPLANVETFQSVARYEPKKPSFLEINNKQEWKRDDLTEFEEY